MGQKKLLLVLLVVVLLGAGWFAAMRAATGADIREKQNTLTVQADSFMDKELYVRAIPLYEEALGYHSDLNSSIETKLLKAYLLHGDVSEYSSLVKSRIEAGTATEDEYIKLADNEIASSSLQDALDMIREGIKKTGSEKLKEYYESKR